MKPRASRQQGFSLVELLVTALIFAIGLLGLGIDTVMSRLSSYLLKWHRGLEQG